jgi:hypothetical protein
MASTPPRRLRLSPAALLGLLALVTLFCSACSCACSGVPGAGPTTTAVVELDKQMVDIVNDSTATVTAYGPPAPTAAPQPPVTTRPTVTATATTHAAPPPAAPSQAPRPAPAPRAAPRPAPAPQPNEHVYERMAIQEFGCDRLYGGDPAWYSDDARPYGWYCGTHVIDLRRVCAAEYPGSHLVMVSDKYLAQVGRAAEIPAGTSRPGAHFVCAFITVGLLNGSYVPSI